MTESTFQLREGSMEIDVAHGEDKLTYIHPAFGPNNYEDLREQIIEAGLKPFNMKDASLILFSAFENPEQKYADELRGIMSTMCFYVFNKNLWVPKGVYVIDDNGEKPLDLEENNLENKFSVFQCFQC